MSASGSAQASGEAGSWDAFLRVAYGARGGPSQYMHSELEAIMMLWLKKNST